VFDAYISGGCFSLWRAGVWLWVYGLVAPGSCIVWFFLAWPVSGFLWDFAGLMVVGVVDVNIMVLVFGAGFFGSMRGPLFPGRALCGRGVF
jgi:hypothetical protein